MKSRLWFGSGILVTFVLIAAMLLTGWLWWGRRVWAAPLGGYMGMMGSGDDPWSNGDPQGAGSTGAPITLQQALAGFERYVQDSGDAGLGLAEVMEFEHNFYAIVVDSRTGIGVAELLADKTLGAVSPEMGPNMMWNTNGMGGDMMGRSPRGTTNYLSPDEALQKAQSWLDANRPGTQTDGHADPFAGYYTVHTLKDGQIEGMLSVHGDTGQVWYHSWHGRFLGMLDLGEEESG